MSSISNIDKRDKLSEEVFTYRQTKDNKTIIYWMGKQVTILAGKESDSFYKKCQTKIIKKFN